MDAEICHTVIADTDSDKIKVYKTKVKNSSLKGIERKIRLDVFSKSNNWVKPFYADYTFEVDFVKVGNRWEVQRLVDSVYKDPATINKAREDLKSDDVTFYGKRVLTMANHVGKGWIAIMLGKHISYKTIIPDYIVKAIIFAKLIFNISLIADIIKFRIGENYRDDDKLNFTMVNKTLLEYRKGAVKLSAVISEIKKVTPHDQIINFLNSL